MRLPLPIPHSAFGVLRMMSAAAVLLFSPAAGHAEDPKDDQIRKIEEELSREREQYVKFDVKEKNLLGQLSEIEKRIAEKRDLLASIREKVQVQRSELDVKRRELERLEIEAGDVRSRLGSRVVAYYKYARRGYVKLLATARDLDELRKRMYYLRIIMERDRVLLQRMLGVLTEHRMQVQAVDEKLQVVTRLDQEESEQLEMMKEELEKKVLLLMKIHREKEFYETAVQELQSAARSLKETLAGLDREPVRTVELSSDFVDFKGKLQLPFEGEVIENYHPLGTGPVLTHRGIFIQGESGGAVRAVYDGRVDYSGWLKGYGQIIIINHGSRYFSVCAHLSERKVEEGDLVRTEDVIGLAGESGSLSGPGLYFELREAGESLDPMAWLKVH
ncbi:MAG: peptidoglycan DD-metalloendopeptidase family protein [Deltaproteobacteria bacterium]|nr:peptidoglycan DD-metalloendopeptidase family protein [Deltaproteobacteria bacterium]